MKRPIFTAKNANLKVRPKYWPKVVSCSNNSNLKNPSEAKKSVENDLVKVLNSSNLLKACSATIAKKKISIR